MTVTWQQAVWDYDYVENRVLGEAPIYYETLEGEVISSHKSFWGNTYFIISLQNGEIKEVNIKKVTVKQ